MASKEKERPSSAPQNDESSSTAASPSSSQLPKQSLKDRLRALWTKTGLQSRQLKTMFKGSWPPVIALAWYQYEPFEVAFPTLGYLVAIASILSLSILPRAKFVQGMMFSLIGVAIGLCVALLSSYCAVEARAHTSSPRSTSSIGASGAQQAVVYNSSASAVSGVFLFFNVLIANALRFSRPQLQIPVILYSIFANIAGTFSPQFASMSQVYVFIRQLATAFLSGFGIATVCHFFIFPFSSRDVVDAELRGYCKLLQKVATAQREYLQSMESPDMLRDFSNSEESESTRFEKASAGLKGSVAALSGLHAKIQADLPFAKREITYGYMRASDISAVFTDIRMVFMPLVGLASVVDIFERLVQKRDWKDTDPPEGAITIREEVSEWNEIMQALHDPFDHVVAGIVQGIEHVTYCLRLEKMPKKDSTDIESDPEIRPGDPNFGQHLEAISAKFWERRSEALKIWCSHNGVPFLDHKPENPEPYQARLTRVFSHGNSRSQLYLILYMEYLLHCAAQAVIVLVKQADRLVENGTMKKRRLILPGKKRMIKWFKGAFKGEDTTNDHAIDSLEDKAYTVKLGDAFRERRDPEHLPPANSFQRVGLVILKTVVVLRSNEVAFGFRVACATMSIAIIAFLEKTQAFFIEQRLVWAMIMVAISMTMTSGSGIFGFIARIGGTAAAMCSSLVIWYVAGGKGVPVGVLILLFFAMSTILYLMQTFPLRFMPVWMITMVTHCLILGYELQVDKVGIAAQTATGQIYYPIYLLGPYRLATVAAGCTVAFFWTYFPYPITAGNTLRRQLGETLYLMSNYYSVVHHTIRTRLNSSGGDPNDRTSPIALLDKARIKLLGKLLAMNSVLEQNISFIPLEFSFGGKFPLDDYKALVKSVSSLRNYVSLLSYSTRDYMHDPHDVNKQWLEDLNKITAQAGTTSHEITKMLILLSSSILDGRPLPPYMTTPPAFNMSKKLSQMDPEILSAKHFLEPGYASFAVTQVAGKLINDDLVKMLKLTKNLVGEVDFSFHVVSTAATSTTTLANDDNKGKQD